MHGNVPDNFKKLFSSTARDHPNQILLQTSAIMGPADEPNSKIPAGWTYFGQYVDHDLTFDRQDGTNARTPIFDLDSLYGKGPGSAEHGSQFEGTNGSETFKIGNSGNPEGDLIRAADFKAVIPDPRNDENVIIASLQLLFQKLHNFLVVSEGLSFGDAKKAVLWHYQAVVFTDFLPRIVGDQIVQEILQNGRKIFTASQISDVFMPTEYSGACYRFGHSMVRSRYSFNDIFNDARSNPNLFFDFPGGRPVSGGHQITDIWTHQGPSVQAGGYQSLLRFFDPTILDPLRDADNFSGKIDTKLPDVLFNLEVPTGETNILALRNLQSGQRLQLPNGQQVVAALQNLGLAVTPLLPEEIIDTGAPTEISTNTPLWFYVLKEAEIQEKGETLGRTGGFIVAETIIGLLQSDPSSVVNKTSNWPFKIGDQNSDAVSMVDVIKYVNSKDDANIVI